MEANQIRAARALLNWSQGKLVEITGLSLTTIRRMEDDQISPSRSSAGNVDIVRTALESAGVIFVSDGEISTTGTGVRLKRAVCITTTETAADGTNNASQTMPSEIDF